MSSALVHRLEYGRWFLAFAGGVLAFLFTWYEWVTPLDRMSYDFINEMNPIELSDDIVIVAIDEDSLQEYGRWPWPREYHVQLLRRLYDYGVKAVAMDVVFSEPQQDYPEVDALLAEALQELSVSVLPVFIARSERYGGALLEVLPLPALQRATKAIGHVHIEVDSDGVARTVFLEEGLGDKSWPHLALALAKKLNQAPAQIPGRVRDGSAALSTSGVIYRNFEGLIPFVGPVGTVPRVSFADVLNGSAPVQSLRDKVVFVGATAAGHVDNITTSLGQISGVEVNANIFQGLRLNAVAQIVDVGARAPVSAVLVFMIILAVTWLEPRPLLLAVAGSVMAFSVLSCLLFLQGYWWSPVPMILALLITYLLWNWVRLETALRAVRHQIAVLRTEGRRVREDSPLPRLHRTLSFMQSLKLIERWSLTELPHLDSNYKPESWYHIAGRTQRIVSAYPGHLKLDLCWASDQNPLSERQLDMLFSTRVSPRIVRNNLPNIDIDLLEQAYREAKHSRALTQASLEHLFSAVILADMSGSILIQNQRAKQLLGSSRNGDDLFTTLQHLQWIDAPPLEVLLARLLTDGEGFTHEARLGQQAYYLCRGRVINLDRPMLLVAISDVTDLKRSELQRAEALNFLSHDLRAPLTSVLALIDGARKEGCSVSDENLLDDIEHYIQRNLSYAENYIYLSRLQHSEPPRQDECDAQSLVDNAIAQLYHTITKRGITLNITCADDTLWVSCNRVMIERVLLNLLDNAIKYSPDNSEVRVGVASVDGTVHFTVQDQGPGIGERVISRMLEAFSQGDNARDGVGLGLRFVGLAAEVHGGQVMVKNLEEGGSCFTFILPRLFTEFGRM